MTYYLIKSNGIIEAHCVKRKKDFPNLYSLPLLLISFVLGFFFPYHRFSTVHKKTSLYEEGKKFYIALRGQQERKLECLIIFTILPFSFPT